METRAPQSTDEHNRNTRTVSPQNEKIVPEESAVSERPTTPKAISATEGLLVLGVSAIAYFLGWRFLFAYYSGFGLDPSLFVVSPTEVIFAGWRIYGLIAGLIVSAVVMRSIIQGFLRHSVQKQRLKAIVRGFYLLLAISVVIGLYVVSQLVWFFFGSGSASFIFYAFAFTDIALLWATFVFGEYIHRVARPTVTQDSVFTLYRIVFAVQKLWVVVIALATVLILALFSSGSGVVYSARDRQPETRLNKVTFYVDRQLSIPNGIQISDEVWCYSDLRLVTKTDDTYFAFRLDEVINDTATLYGIPKDRVIEFQTRPWYDRSDIP
ncbi:MAG: hypothetical protein JXA33_01575 [Anaerolineae bacterium]|nr:hypothetical protein [Anaerolineae bacterium]